MAKVSCLRQKCYDRMAVLATRELENEGCFVYFGKTPVYSEGKAKESNYAWHLQV